MISKTFLLKEFCNFIEMKILYSLLSILFLSTSIQAQDYDIMAAYLDSLAANNRVEASVVLYKNGEVLFQKQTGYIDAARTQKANAKTKYRIGSITKTYTSTMIHQLIDKGRLKTITQLAEFFPEIEKSNYIGLNYLLGHSSGIHNFTNDELYKTYYTEPQSRIDMMNMIKKLPRDFKVNEKHEYSNTNYVLLGYILEDIYKKPYAQILETQIASPMGLKNTYFGSDAKTIKNEARSFTYNGNEWIVEDETDMSVPGGAGAIVSTPLDMAIFMEKLMTKSVVTDESLNNMLQIEKGYGKGLFRLPFYSDFVFGHNGGIDGFSSTLYYVPKDSLIISICVNANNYSSNEFILDLLKIQYNKGFEMKASYGVPKVPVVIISSYTGHYTCDSLPIDIDIRVKEGELFAQGTGQPEFRLTPKDDILFEYVPAGLEILFQKKGDRVLGFQLKQGGGLFDFKLD